MARFLKKRTATDGMAPGSLVFVGAQKMEQPVIHLIEYDARKVRERDISDISGVPALKRSSPVTWVNVYGVHDSGVIQEIGAKFSLHSLILEDIMNTGQRPKFEDHDACLVMILKMMRYDKSDKMVHAEQLTLVLARNYVLTFQERPGDVFGPVRERIRKKKGRVRSLGTDYLAYSLLDTVVDNYMSVTERFGGMVEDLDEDVLEHPTEDTLERINTLRKEINYLRKSVRPAREAILALARSDSSVLRTSTAPYLRDLLDLSTQAAEAIDTYRDMLSDHLGNYNAAVSYRLNDIMRVLTIYAAIFIPLTFLVGIYGMNFENLPELHFKYGYYVLWTVMVSVAGGMVLYFKKKGWL